MKRLLSDKPIHSFLIGIYIVSVFYVQNIDKVGFSSILRSLFVSLLLSLVVFAVAYFIFRSPRKAGIFTTILIIGLAGYGIIYDQIEILLEKGYWPFAHVHRFLASLYFIFYLTLLIFFYRSKLPHYNVNFILNCFIFFIFLFNILSGIISPRKAVTNLQNPFLSDPVLATVVPDSNDTLPDVYYIVLDGFASEHVLKKSYGSTNNHLYDYLRKKGFYVAEQSYANYPVTATSLSSSLNLNYLDTFTNINPYGLIKQNLVTGVFRKMGYRIQNIQSGYSVTNVISNSDKTVELPSLNEFESELLDLTIFRLVDLFGTRYYNQLQYQFDGMEELINNEGPNFNFIHIVAPHPPYIVDSAGNRKIAGAMAHLPWEPRESYLTQLKYVSHRMTQFLDTLFQRSARPPVIILQSDHGPWINDKGPAVYDARISILNSFYFPDSARAKLYPAITPVNSFRVLFSEVFKLPYSRLPDIPFPVAQLEATHTFQLYSK